MIEQMSKERRRGLLVERILTGGSGSSKSIIRDPDLGSMRRIVLELVRAEEITYREGDVNGVLDKLTPLASEDEARGKVYLGKTNAWGYNFFHNDHAEEPLWSACEMNLLDKEMEVLRRIARTEGDITVYCLSETPGPFKVSPHSNGERCEIYQHVTSFYRDQTTEGEKSK